MVAGRFIAVEVGPGLHRVELPGATLGLMPPPAYTELSLRRSRQDWAVQALASRGQADAMGRWLVSVGAQDVQPGGGREPTVRARFGRLPDPLAYAASLLTVERVGLGSDGSAFLLARGARSKFQELLTHLESKRMPENAVPELTARQAELLQHCADRGYYDIPRRVTLADLASDLGISPTALSRALRRAEARILRAYVERLRHNLPRRAPAKGPARRAKRSA